MWGWLVDLDGFWKNNITNFQRPQYKHALDFCFCGKGPFTSNIIFYTPQKLTSTFSEKYCLEDGSFPVLGNWILSKRDISWYVRFQGGVALNQCWKTTSLHPPPRWLKSGHSSIGNRCDADGGTTHTWRRRRHAWGRWEQLPETETQKKQSDSLKSVFFLTECPIATEKKPQKNTWASNKSAVPNMDYLSIWHDLRHDVSTGQQPNPCWTRALKFQVHDFLIWNKNRSW